MMAGIRETFGPTDGSIPLAADYLYLYEEEYEEETEENEGDAVKNETSTAYDKVGDTAHLKGNLKKAKAVMSYLGYTDEEF
jgi:dihydroxyacid dehydratase/phosphogluconate dehydratase